MPEHTPAPTPARSLYGFFMYLFSKTIFTIYIIWAFTPDCYLHLFNIYYYPLKYWATAVPIQVLVALTLFAFFIYPSSNMILTPHIDSLNTIEDPITNYKCKKKCRYKIPSTCICVDASICYRSNYSLLPEGDESVVPQLHDLDIRFVSKKLYFNK